MLDADAVINNQKVGGSNAYPDPAPKKWVGPDPEKHIGSRRLLAARWSSAARSPVRRSSDRRLIGQLQAIGG